MTTKIKWKRSDEGYVDSHCERFFITPLYCSRCQPLFFKIERYDKDKSETQREAKAAAEYWLDQQENPEKYKIKTNDLDWDSLL